MYVVRVNSPQTAQTSAGASVEFTVGNPRVQCTTGRVRLYRDISQREDEQASGPLPELRSTTVRLSH